MTRYDVSLPLAPSLGWVSPLILGLDICYDGILLTTDYQGRSSGEAFVRFSNRTSAERALERNKERIGHRWEYLTLPQGF